MKKMQDQNIHISLLQLGNEKEILRWYRTFELPITKYIRSQVSNAEDVQELVQNVFLTCLESLPLFQQQSSLWTWMCSIARHEVADYYRKKYAKRVLQCIPFMDALLPEQVADMHDVSSIVLSVLQKLSHADRELLQLKYVDGLSVKHIAVHLCQSIKSVESKLFRARKAFEELYAKEAV